MIWNVASLFLPRFAVLPVNVCWFHMRISWSQAPPLSFSSLSMFFPRAERPSRAQVTNCLVPLGTAAHPDTTSSQRVMRQEPALPSCIAGMRMLWGLGCAVLFPSLSVGAQTWSGAGACPAPGAPGGAGPLSWPRWPVTAGVAGHGPRDPWARLKSSPGHSGCSRTAAAPAARPGPGRERTESRC